MIGTNGAWAAQVAEISTELITLTGNGDSQVVEPGRRGRAVLKFVSDTTSGLIGVNVNNGDAAPGGGTRLFIAVGDVAEVFFTSGLEISLNTTSGSAQVAMYMELL